MIGLGHVGYDLSDTQDGFKCKTMGFIFCGKLTMIQVSDPGPMGQLVKKNKWKGCGNTIPGPMSFGTSLKFLFTCAGTSLKKFNTILYFRFHNYDEHTCSGENCVNPDQVTSEFFRNKLIWIYSVFNRVYI